MGIELDNYSIRESLLIMEKFLNDTALNTVQMVNMELLALADTDPLVKEALSQCEFTVIGDRAILETAGVTSGQHLGEIDNKSFFVEFMKRIYRSNRSIYLIGQTQDEIDKFKKYLIDNFEHLKIVGEYAIDDCTPEYDDVVNDINIIMPDIILSVIPSPLQEKFLMEHKNKMCARLWYGMGTDGPHDRRSLKTRKLWRKVIGSKLFHHRVTRYENEQKGNERL